MPLDIDKPCAAYIKNSRYWRMIDDLWGGTETMREAGELYLPRETDETPDSYDARLKHTFLFEGYKDGIEYMVGKPFGTNITIGKGLPEFDDLQWDMDGSGLSLTQLSKNMFEDALKFGYTHSLVDYPAIPPGATKADERELNARPQAVHISARALIWWQHRRDQKLDFIRILEEVDEGGDTVDQVREIGRDYWKTYRKSKKWSEERNDWKVYDSGDNTLGRVPLVTFYTKRKGRMLTEPPMLKLAWLNLHHWLSSSEQANSLRFGRFGMIFASGFTEGELRKGFVVGPGRMIASENKEATAKVLEPNGTAIAAGRQDLSDIEKRMEVLGMRPFVDRTAKATATSKRIDTEGSISIVKAWIIDLEHSIEQVFELLAGWTGQKVSADFSIDIEKNFDTIGATGSTGTGDPAAAS